MSKTFIDRTNETNMSTYGQLMTIIKYRNVKDIDVLFENGTIVEHKSYENFLRGNIRNPNLRLGETSISSKGQQMKIIAYHSADNVDIEFEDGTIVTNKSMSEFRKGKIGNPNFILPYTLNSIIIEKLAYKSINRNYYCTCTLCGYKDIMNLDEIKSHICNKGIE